MNLTLTMLSAAQHNDSDDAHGMVIAVESDAFLHVVIGQNVALNMSAFCTYSVGIF
jgi:hypothetical protein